MAVCKVKDLDPNLLLTFNRAGVIPYRHTENGVEVVMGIDRASKDKSNFAGKPRRFENAFDAAKREFKEETLGVFGNIDRTSLDNSMAVYNNNEINFFYKCNYDKEKALLQFIKRVKPDSEMENLYFCNLDQLFDLMTRNQDGGIYSRVRSLLVDAFYENGLFLNSSEH